MTNGFSKLKRPRISAVICGCEGGAYHPVFELSRILHNDFESVEIICDAATVPAAAESGVPAYELAADCSAGHYYLPLIERLLKNEQQLTGSTANPLEIWAGKAAATLMDSAGFAAPDIILSSLFGQPLAAALASRLGVPWVFVNPAFSYLDQSYRDWSLDFSPTGAQMYRHWLLPFTEKADVILHATDPLFDCAEAAVKENERYLGPLFYEHAISLPPSLAAETSGACVIATISSSPQPDDQDLLEIVIEAGKSIAYPMIVTARDSGTGSRYNHPGIKVTGYLPHSALLKKCRYIICHGGHGTVMKAMTAGTPMIIVPWGRDQSGTARRAERLGLAVVIPRDRFDSRSLVDAANHIEKSPEYRLQATKHAARLRRSKVFENAYRMFSSCLSSLAD